MTDAGPQVSNLISDAARAETTQDLARLLRQLRRRDARRRGDTELTYRELASKCGWSLGIIGEYFVGTVLPPTDRFDILIQLLGATRDEQKALATARDRVEEHRRFLTATEELSGCGTRRSRNQRMPNSKVGPGPDAAAAPDAGLGPDHDPAVRAGPSPGTEPRVATAEQSPGHADGGWRQPGPAVPIPHQLPAVPKNFTGRTVDLVRLDGLLPSTGRPLPADPSTTDGFGPVIAVVSGIPGVGKTTLALVWAHRSRALFPDGQLYVNLRGYDPEPPATAGEVLDGFLRALGVQADRIPPTAPAQAGLFRSLLDGRRMLMVLDNAHSAEQVRPLLPGSPSCLVLITSRVRLTGLAVSVGAVQIDLDVLPLDDAVTLLRRLIGDQRADAEPLALHGIVTHCGGLPLALRLIGQRAAARPAGRIGDLAAELTAEPCPLDVLSAGADEITAVRSVFSWSYHSLPTPQARLFRLLGLHPGSEISSHAAAAVAGLPLRRARSLLDNLTDTHLIEFVTTDRYRFHDLLRAYARERVEAEEHLSDRTMALRRLVGFYLHTAAAADVLLHPGKASPAVDAAPPPDCPMTFSGYDQALAWCEAERGNLASVTRASVAIGIPAAAWQLPAGMWSFFYIRKYWTDWINICTIGLRAADRSADTTGRARMLSSLAVAFRDLHRHDEAIDHFLQVLDLVRDLGDPVRHGSALANLGDAYLAAGRYDEAVEHSRQAIKIFHEVGNLYYEGIALGNLSEAYLGLRRYEQALDGFRLVLEQCRAINHRHGEGVTLIHLGEAYLGLHRHEEAISHLTRALAVCHSTGNTYGVATVWKTLGEVNAEAGRQPEALLAWQEALRIFDLLGSPEAGKIRARLRPVDD